MDYTNTSKWAFLFLALVQWPATQWVAESVVESTELAMVATLAIGM